MTDAIDPILRRPSTMVAAAAPVELKRTFSGERRPTDSRRIGTVPTKWIQQRATEQIRRGAELQRLHEAAPAFLTSVADALRNDIEYYSEHIGGETPQLGIDINALAGSCHFHRWQHSSSTTSQAASWPTTFNQQQRQPGLSKV